MQQTSAAEALKIWQARVDFAKGVFGEGHLFCLRTQLDLAQYLRTNDGKDAARQLAREIATPMRALLAKSAVERLQLATLLHK
jgi:hypothetical protein